MNTTAVPMSAEHAPLASGPAQRPHINSASPFFDRLLDWDAPNAPVKTQLVEHRRASTRKTVIFANVLVACVITAALWEVKPHSLLLGWLSAVTIVAGLLAWSMSHYSRHKAARSPQVWALRFTLGGLVNGLTWGSGALLLFDPATPDTNLLMTGVICGMTAGNVVTSFAIPLSAYAYLVPAILLSMAMPITQGSSAEHTLALLWIPYLVIMVVLTRSAHKGLARSIFLSEENAHLAQKLAAAKEQAEQLAQAKANFLAVMSHEIRTPMHGMLGVAELLANTPLDTRQRQYLDHLQGSGEYLSQLLNNILDYSKIEAEKLVLNRTPFALPELIGEVASLFALQAVRKGLLFEASFPDEVAIHWHGDPHRIKQILINLLGNAFKFTVHGTIKLEVIHEEESDHQARFRFRVSDTGPGIPPTLLANIFEPFTQESSVTTPEFAGTGLGLAISKRLVEAMGGELVVASTAGQGSIFSFTLLLAPAGDSRPSIDAAEMDDGTGLPPARILLADDSPFNRLVVREFLKEAPCSIEEAENGLTAVEMYQSTQHDIILMDMRMPELDGIETVRRIRQWEAEQEHGPALIIMLTASVFESDRVAFMAAGCDEVLTKPVQRGTLIRLLHKNANRARPTTAQAQ